MFQTRPDRSTCWALFRDSFIALCYRESNNRPYDDRYGAGGGDLDEETAISQRNVRRYRPIKRRRRGRRWTCQVRKTWSDVVVFLLNLSPFMTNTINLSFNFFLAPRVRAPCHRVCSRVTVRWYVVIWVVTNRFLSNQCDEEFYRPQLTR